MLHAWLAPTPVEEFVQHHLHRQPWARPGGARDAVDLLDWERLDRVLRADPAPDVLVVARGELLEIPAPRSLGELRSLMDVGIGLVLRRTERCDPDLAAFAAAFARDLPGEVHVQLFVTPGGTHGFGWHHDSEDVFIAQTAGVKDYYFRANTVDAGGPSAARPDFGRVREEASPLMTARLIPGDCLYIPARWWHMARCIESSLSISLGVYPR